MAKTAKEKTAAQKATLDARQKVELATQKNTATPNELNKRNLDTAQAHLKQCVATENRERFVLIGGGRVKKARQAIRNFANVAQPRSYSFTEADIAKAETALNEEVKKTIAKLRASLVKGASVAKAEDDFTF